MQRLVTFHKVEEAREEIVERLILPMGVGDGGLPVHRPVFSVATRQVVGVVVDLETLDVYLKHAAVLQGRMARAASYKKNNPTL